MSPRTNVIALAGVCLLAHGALAQDPVAAPNPVGVWRGTSKCTVRPSPCNDEIVVYRITRVNASDSLSIDARKIVNGQEGRWASSAAAPPRRARNSRALCRMVCGASRFAATASSAN